MMKKILNLLLKYLIIFILILITLFIFEKPAPVVLTGANVRFFTTMFFLIGPFVFLAILIAHTSLIVFKDKNALKNILNKSEITIGEKYAALIPFLIIISLIAFKFFKISFFPIALLIFSISLYSLSKLKVKNFYTIFPFLGIFYFLFYFIYFVTAKF